MGVEIGFDVVVILLLCVLLVRQEKIMSDLDTLNTEVGEVVADEATIATDLATIIGDLKALEGQANPDLSGAIAALATLHTKLQADDAAVVAAEPAPAAPATPAV